MASEKKNSTKLNFLNLILGVAIVLFFGLLIIYYFNIFDLDTTKKSDWGTFGDFIGGTLNPIFALFSLFAIIYTIKIQTEELELSREELKETKEELRESRIAQQEQSESLRLQNKATSLQMFENTFFQLLNLFIETKNNLFYVHEWYVRTRVSPVELKTKEFNSLEVIKYLLNKLKKDYGRNYNKFNIENESFTGAYFGQIYQILKFIDTNEIENKQRYINIFRAQFTKEELELLFYHCLGDIGKNKFKQLIEEYEFFEHLIHNDDIDKPLREYKIKAFGNNEILLNKYKKVNDN